MIEKLKKYFKGLFSTIDINNDGKISDTEILIAMLKELEELNGKMNMDNEDIQPIKRKRVHSIR